MEAKAMKTKTMEAMSAMEAATATLNQVAIEAPVALRLSVLHCSRPLCPQGLHRVVACGLGIPHRLHQVLAAWFHGFRVSSPSSLS